MKMMQVPSNDTPILIVEDEIIISDTIVRYLLKANYNNLYTATSYEEAVEILKTSPIEVAILDIRLKTEKTGIDIAQFIRKQKDHTIIIYLTSHHDRHTLSLAKATLPDTYIIKPVKKEDLLTLSLIHI